MSSSQRRAGIVLSYVSLLIGASAALVTVPIMLEYVSISDYGVYELAASLVAYLSLVDAGFSTALTRYVVRLRNGSPLLLPSLMTTSVAIYAFLTLIGVVAVIALQANLEVIFGSSFTRTELSVTDGLLNLVLINCLILLPGNWFVALISAEERFVFLRGLSIVRNLLQVAFILVALQVTENIWWVLAAQTLVNLIVLVVQIVYSTSKLAARPIFGRPSWRLFVKLGSFAGNVLLIILFDLVFWRTGQMVLGATTGAAALAVYAVASRFISTGFLQLSTAMSGVFLPRLTSLHSSGGNRTEINRLFVSVGRIQAMIAWGAIGAFVAVGRVFVDLWVGPQFHEVYIIVVLLMFGLSISTVQSIGNQLMQAENRLRFRSILYVSIACLFLIYSPAIASSGGPIGVAMYAALLLLIATGPILNFYYHRQLKLDVRAFIVRVFPILIPVSGATLVAVLVTPLFPLTWFGLICSCLSFLVAYTGLLWAFLDDSERTLLHLRRR